MGDSHRAQSQGESMKGHLWKWTNYIRGYQKRWFVLSDGLLSYYRLKSEVNHACRGTINLAGATIEVIDSVSFVIWTGGSQTYYLRANTEADRLNWVLKLEMAKSKAMTRLESDNSDEEPSEVTVQNLASKLEDVVSCNNVLLSQSQVLQKSMADLQDSSPHKDLYERVHLFRIASGAIVKASKEFVEGCQNYEKQMERVMKLESAKRLGLEETIETLAKQHNVLEKVCRKGSSLNSPKNQPSNSNREASDSSMGEDNDEEFFDAVSVPDNGTTLTYDPYYDSGEVDSAVESLLPSVAVGFNEKLTRSSKKPSHQRSVSDVVDDQRITEVKKQQRYRTSIQFRPNVSMSLWSIMKNCVGKELTKIPMPVNFNEPLSMLQRLTEELEYTELLDQAAACDSPLEQICRIAAYTVSCYSSTALRTGKPFNPLLGETYECDRTHDRGWRSICEQVSHHPPSCAMHAEGRGWTLYQNFLVTSKFRGKYLQVTPIGITHCIFQRSGHHYTWGKVNTTVHNIIVGTLWIDQSGDLEIRNQNTGDTAFLKYHPYSIFSRELPKKVSGVVQDQSGETRYLLNGYWDQKFEYSKVTERKGDTGKGLSQPTLSSTVLWLRQPPMVNSDKMYNFSQFTCSLNQPESGVAPTDSRHRPDQRLMEEGKFDEANQVKTVLEEKQRQRRRKKEAEAEEHQPAWFSPSKEPYHDMSMFVYKGGYWEAKEKNTWPTSVPLFDIGKE